MNRDGAISMSEGLYSMVWVSIQEHNSNATVCHVNHHGLILFGILEGAPLFLCDIISQWLGYGTLVETACLKFLTVSASAVLTSD